MSIYPTDVFLKTLLEESIEDVKKNPWLLDYIFWDFTHNEFLKQKYGKKQLDACKVWFENNTINVFHQYIKDREKFPAIVITLGSSVEHQEYRTLSDVGEHTIGFIPPSEVGQKIPYVVPPFVPVGFVPNTGIIESPLGTDLSAVSAGMIILNPVNGNGTPVLSVDGQNIIIQAGLELDASQLAVVPQYRYFQTRLGRSFFQENWNLTCATNDPQTLLWLHTLVVFSMLRYREFMEHNGLYEITNFSSTDIFNADFSNAAGEEIYCRQISFSNKVEQTWPRGLHKKLESILLRDTNPAAVTLENPDGYVGGIKIVSNLNTPALDQNNQNWYTTVASEENEDDEFEFEE